MAAADEAMHGAAAGYECKPAKAIKNTNLAAFEDEKMQRALLFDIRGPQILAHLRNVWNLVILKAGHYKGLKQWSEWARKESQEFTMFTKKVLEMMEAGISADVIKTACDSDATFTEQQKHIFSEMVDHARSEARIQEAFCKQPARNSAMVYKAHAGRYYLKTNEASEELAAAALAAPPEEHPAPLYTEEDDPCKPGGLACYYAGCSYHGRSWLRICEHIRRKHKRPFESLRGTYLYAMANAEKSQQGRTTYNKIKEEPASAGSRHNDHPGNDEACESNMFWAIRPCWVKCKANGDQAEPLECAGVAEFQPLRENLRTSSRARSPYERPEKKPVHAAVGAGLTHSQNASQPTPRSSSTKAGNSDSWILELPFVAVKTCYISWSDMQREGGEARSRVSYPAELKGDVLQLPGFKVYLEKTRHSRTASCHLLHVGRALGALEVKGE